MSRGVLTTASPTRPPQFIQTDRETHEAWGRLTASKPRAAALMHFLVAQMGRSDAVVASWGTLAELSGMSVATVRRAIADLRAERWIELVAIGGKGAANAIVINSRVAWTQERDKLRYARFSAQVVARAEEQQAVDTAPLRPVPVLYPNEKPLPAGDGEPPPTQPSLEGFTPDPPIRRRR